MIKNTQKKNYSEIQETELNIDENYLEIFEDELNHLFENNLSHNNLSQNILKQQNTTNTDIDIDIHTNNNINTNSNNIKKKHIIGIKNKNIMENNLKYTKKIFKKINKEKKNNNIYNDDILDYDDILAIKMLIKYLNN